MSTARAVLERVEMFKHLTAEERHEVETLAVQGLKEIGDPVFREGEAGDSLYIVLTGAVELRTAVMGGVENPLITLREGGVFGLVECIEPGPRQVSAIPVEPTELLQLARKPLKQFVESHPGSGKNLLFALSVGLSRQMRLLLEILRDNLAWTLEASGAAQLNLQQLVTDDVHLVIDLMNGQQVQGRLLKVEPGPAGHDLLIKTDEQQLRFVPYHAVAGLSFPSRATASGAVPTESI